MYYRPGFPTTFTLLCQRLMRKAWHWLSLPRTEHHSSRTTPCVWAAIDLGEQKWQMKLDGSHHSPLDRASIDSSVPRSQTKITGVDAEHINVSTRLG